MNSLATDIRRLVIDRLERMSTAEIITIIDATPNSAPVPTLIRPRFTKLDMNGQPDSAADWVAVYDSSTNLTWTAAPLDCGEASHADALKAATDLRLFGQTDWRAPTIEEQLSIVDYQRFDPAVDPSYFKGPYSWTWTSTVAKSSSGYAWGVVLANGNCHRHRQSSHGYVRAVRAGQQLTFAL